jgi:hypothetical protein
MGDAWYVASSVISSRDAVTHFWRTISP